MLALLVDMLDIGAVAQQQFDQGFTALAGSDSQRGVAVLVMVFDVRARG